MKLDELEIGDRGAAVVRNRDSVACRDGRIRRLAKDLTRAAGRDQCTRPRGPGDRPVSPEVPNAAHVRCSTMTRTARACGSHPHVGHPAHALPEHASDFAPGRVVRVQNTPHAVRPLDRERGTCRRRRDRRRHPTRSAREHSADLPRPAPRPPARHRVHRPRRACRRDAAPDCRQGRRPRRCRPARSPYCRRADPPSSERGHRRRRRAPPRPASAAMPLPIMRKSASAPCNLCYPTIRARPDMPSPSPSSVAAPVRLDVGSRNGRYPIHIAPSLSLTAVRAARRARRAEATAGRVEQCHLEISCVRVRRPERGRADSDRRRRAVQESSDSRPHLRRPHSPAARIDPAR